MARLLIVDDEPVNRELLFAYLEGLGHELVEAGTADEALARARERTPDLVLLDVMLPGMNGFEATPRLKAIAGSQFLPVVLLTALSDQASRTLGLQAGADEFLTKPVDRQELLVRINNLLALRAKEQALLQRNTELVELRRWTDEMTGLIVHDLKNPMSAILANYQFLTEELRSAAAVDASIREAIEDSNTAAKRMMRLIANLLDLSRLEAQRLELRRAPTRPAELLTGVVSQRRLTTRSRKITLETELDADIEVKADPDLVTRVMENIFDNALRHTPNGGQIVVRCGGRPDGAHIEIGNSGPRVPDEARTRIFEKYGQSSASHGRMNLGLGLYFCRLAVESHGGRIWVDETPTFPTVFAVDLPAEPPTAAS